MAQYIGVKEIKLSVVGQYKMCHFKILAFEKYHDLETQIHSMSLDWIGLSSVLHPRQHSIGYMGDGFYKSKDPTNSIKVLKEQIVHRQ